MPEVDPVFLLSFLSAVLLCLIIFNQARRALGKEGKIPQPLHVELAKEFTPLERTEKLEHEVRRGFSCIGTQIAKVESDRRASVSRVYETTRTSIAEIRGELKGDNEKLRTELRTDLRQMHESVDGLHTRINDVLKAVSRLEGKVT